MLSNLPQELIELILAALDVECLRSCSLVSSSLLAPSQRMIFRSLFLPNANFSKVQSLFAIAPHILGYVRDLHVELVPRVSSQNQNGVLLSILTSCHHLQFLSIASGGRTLAEWDDMPLPLQSAVHDLLPSALKLHTLVLLGIRNVPSSFISRALSSIKRLLLCGINAQDSKSHLPSRFETARTEHFSLLAPSDGMKPIVDLILPDTCPPRSLHSIRGLTLGMHRDVEVQSLRLIVATVNTLRLLRLQCADFQTPFSLPRLPVLQEIELRFFWSVGLSQHLDITLASFPTAIPNIELLRLGFHGALPDRENLAEERTSPFPLFDGACAYRKRLPRLARVHCHWRSEQPSPLPDFADFNEYIRGKFPGLSDRVLEVSGGGDPDDIFY
ncbi:hypothetical protein MVEN_01473900 [Mycena venus]|uniref:F-box domain-containing protein n=1 Tax=Mycena venus TaxID=2733690 RepID=A0A8H6XV85_9AGAR|nr:hypothetical protein MVEN_01473900 [Mycena venus]